MPELPEVETLCRQLRKAIVGRIIVGSRIVDRKLDHVQTLAGERVDAVSRRGKRMIWSLSGGRCLAFQLRMTGRFFWVEGEALPPHTRFILEFDSGRLALSDPRRFATIEHIPPPPESAVADGLSPLDAKTLYAAARKRTLPVKSFLMDQKTVSGIGNIYASEILHAARVAPRRPACSLKPADWERVAGATSEILQRAVECRGTSVSDWQDLFACRGEYQDHLRVYGRAGCACPGCGQTLRRDVIAGRSTFFCPRCQK